MKDRLKARKETDNLEKVLETNNLEKNEWVAKAWKSYVEGEAEKKKKKKSITPSDSDESENSFEKLDQDGNVLNNNDVTIDESAKNIAEWLENSKDLNEGGQYILIFYLK